MINEFDEKGSKSKNFGLHKEIMSEDLSISDIVKMVDKIEYLVHSSDCHCIHKEADEVTSVIAPFKEIAEKCKTDVCCPKCDKKLYLSDLPQYDYVCPNCDENF